MNTPVSFEIAKLLKEKGIKIESSQDDEIYGYCYCKYYKGSDYKLVSNAWRSLRQYTLNFTQDSQRYDYVTSPVYEAPTIADVIMWLYEKHNLWILPLPTITGYFAYKIVDVQLNPDKPIERPPYKDVSAHDYSTPTEAYEAAIEYTLKNLI